MSNKDVFKNYFFFFFFAAIFHTSGFYSIYRCSLLIKFFDIVLQENKNFSAIP